MELLDKLEKSKKYISEDKISDAISLLQEILSDKDKEFHRDAFFELGKIFYFQKKYDLAEKNMYSAFLMEKSNKNTILLLAKILKENKKKWNSIRLFLKLRKLNGNDTKEIDSEIISIFLSTEKYISAIKYIDKYCSDEIDKKNRIYKYLLRKITMLNNLNDFTEAKKISGQSLQKLTITDKKIKNSILNEFEIANDIVCLKSFPRSLTISLTEKCNLKCKMCSQYKINRKKELTEEQVNNIINLFPFVEKVLWVGGEVFLYRNFEKLMDLANDYDVQQNITSNGLLITDNYARKIVDYGVELNLSIDSVNKDTYEFIREGAAFDILLKNIKRIKYYREQKKEKASFMLNAVLSKWNCNIKNNFFDILYFAKDNSFDGVNIYIDAFEQNKSIRDNLISLFNEQKNDLIELSKKLKLKLNNLVYLDYKDNNLKKQEEVNKKEICEEFVTEKKNSNSINFYINDNIEIQDYDYSKINCFMENCSQQKQCLLPWKKLYISYSGNIQNECHCPNLGQLKNNNVFNFSNVGNSYCNIMEVWNSEKLVTIREEIIKNKLKCIKNCYLNEEYRKPIALR